MKKYFLFSSILLLVSIHITFSQIRNETLKNGVFNNNLETFALQKVKNIYNSEYSKHTIGTYYLFDKWNKCTIINNQGKKIGTTCNYNLFNDQFELKYESELYSISIQNIKTILVNNSQYFPFTNSFKQLKNSSKYYKLLAKGKSIDLIETYNISVQQVSSTNNLGIYENKIKINKKLFFRISGKFISVPNSKRKVFEILNLNDEQIKKYKRRNVKNEMNLIELIKNL